MVPTVFGPGDDGTFSTAVFWPGMEEVVRTELVALHVTHGDACIESYHRTGKLSNLALEDGESHEVEFPVTDEPPPTHDVVFSWDSGRFTRSRQVVLAAIDVQGARFPVMCRVTEETEQSFRVPTEGATFGVVGADEIGTLAAKYQRMTGGNRFDLRLPSDVTIRTVAPQSRAEGVSLLPTLRWSTIPGATLQVVVVRGTNQSAKFVLPGWQDRLDLAYLEALDFRLEEGTEHFWAVLAVASSAEPEDYLAGKIDINSFLPLTMDDFEVYITETSFTTGP